MTLHDNIDTGPICNTCIIEVNLMVIVDRFTKFGIFVPCTQEITSRQTAQILMKEVIARHGTPRETYYR